MEHIKHCMSLYLRLKGDLAKALHIFSSSVFLPFTAPGSSLEPQNVVSAPLELLCFLISIHPLLPSLSLLFFYYTHHPRVALLPASSPESETVTNSDNKARDLDTSLHLNNGATWYGSLVIRTLSAHCVLLSILQQRNRGKEAGRLKLEREGGRRLWLLHRWD